MKIDVIFFENKIYRAIQQNTEIFKSNLVFSHKTKTLFTRNRRCKPYTKKKTVEVTGCNRD